MRSNGGPKNGGSYFRGDRTEKPWYDGRGGFKFSEISPWGLQEGVERKPGAETQAGIAVPLKAKARGPVENC